MRSPPSQKFGSSIHLVGKTYRVNNPQLSLTCSTEDPIYAAAVARCTTWEQFCELETAKLAKAQAAEAELDRIEAEARAANPPPQPTVRGPVTALVQELPEGAGLRVTCKNLAGADVMCADFDMEDTIAELEASMSRVWRGSVSFFSVDAQGGAKLASKDEQLGDFDELVAHHGTDITVRVTCFLGSGWQAITLPDYATLRELWGKHAEASTRREIFCPSMQASLKRHGDMTLKEMGIRDGHELMFA